MSRLHACFIGSRAIYREGSQCQLIEVTDLKLDSFGILASTRCEGLPGFVAPKSERGRIRWPWPNVSASCHSWFLGPPIPQCVYFGDRVEAGASVCRTGTAGSRHVTRAMVAHLAHELRSLITKPVVVRCGETKVGRALLSAPEGIRVLVGEMESAKATEALRRVLGLHGSAVRGTKDPALAGDWWLHCDGEAMIQISAPNLDSRRPYVSCDFGGLLSARRAQRYHGSVEPAD